MPWIYFPEIPEALRQALTPTERTEINVKFNRFFRQGSDLALASSESRPRVWEVI